jgi:hypothetical protein
MSSIGATIKMPGASKTFKQVVYTHTYLGHKAWVFIATNREHLEQTILRGGQHRRNNKDARSIQDIQASGVHKLRTTQAQTKNGHTHCT